MKTILCALMLMISATLTFAQEKPIPLYPNGIPNSKPTPVAYVEKMVKSDDEWVTMVSTPTLTPFFPEKGTANGTAIVIFPGGAYAGLSMDKEGYRVAKAFNKFGVTAFVVKYRLPSDDIMVDKTIGPLQDAQQAVLTVRKHATEWGIKADKIGIIGFSAGGTVAASAAYNYTAESRPDFVAPIYAFMPPALQGTIPADAPPMFLAAASDDQLGLAPHSVDLYSKWLASKHPVELHMYQKGGHGFGMRKQNIPTDTWIDRFGDWLGLNGFLKPESKK